MIQLIAAPLRMQDLLGTVRELRRSSFYANSFVLKCNKERKTRPLNDDEKMCLHVN